MYLADKNCSPITGGPPLTPQQANVLRSQLLLAWQIDPNNQFLYFDFLFINFQETMAFVNALAWIVNQQDHHPDMEIGYKHCLVRYSTHSIGGLSENDFICAAKIEQLVT